MRIMALALVIATAGVAPALADDAVPLPKPRPAAADAAQGAPETSQTAKSAPEPSDCRKALTEAIAIAPSIPSIPSIHQAACGGDDLVRLEAVVLPDGSRATLKPAATLRCPMAAAVAGWVRTDIVPLTEALGSPLTEVDNFDSYDCRGRNRIEGAKLSEHGRANALDVRGFKLGDGA